LKRTRIETSTDLKSCPLAALIVFAYDSDVLMSAMEVIKAINVIKAEGSS
jgi:hypothetical protein